MEKTNKNAKWIVIGSIIFILAILIAVCPILVTKYMRAKWQDGPRYKVSTLLMNVSGKLNISNDNKYYVKGDNGLFYVLENIEQDYSEKINSQCDVIGSFRQAINNETVDGNPVRLFISVQKIDFPDNENLEVENIEEESNDENKEALAKEKALQKAKLRLAVNVGLEKSILFDVIKGNVSSVNRKDMKGEDFVALVLKDDFGDSYMLYKKGKDLSSLQDKRIIVLGREIIPPSNFPLIVDETTFEIYEVYDLDFNKLI
ncbi:hypothetical protein [Candidatus Ruminimicrobiellum ovillum]|uniref:hypothetical protein n=1 Tax=Candidatus Ruminimicrobiellum ovillum TaxID=1947927 RepID=UPI00355A08AD